MKETIITSERELIEAVRRTLSQLEDLSVRLRFAPPDLKADLLCDVEVEGRPAHLLVECRLRSDVRSVELLEAYARDSDACYLLATVKLTPAVVRHCQRLGVNCIDLNGRIWLRAPGILVDIAKPTKGERFRLPEPEVNLFSPKSSRLVRVLLAHAGREWKQAGLAGSTGLSQSLISRLLNYATKQNWVNGARGDWRVVDADSLLDAWAEADQWQKRGTVRQYSTLQTDQRTIANDACRWLSGSVVFTQWFAADLRFPYAEVPVVSAYVELWPEADTLRQLGWREVSDGGRIWLITPKDEGVFQEIREVDGHFLVCDPQIYLDLLQVGLRGPDHAEALRNWEEFCSS